MGAGRGIQDSPVVLHGVSGATIRGQHHHAYAQWLEEVDDIDVETPTAENPTV